MLFDQLPNMNKSLLERTNIYFRPPRSTKSVELSVNGTTVSNEYRVAPTVILYVGDDVGTIDLNTQELYKAKIGKIISKELINTTVSLTELETKIITALDIDVKGVDIQNLCPNNSKIFYVTSTDNSLVLDKSLTVTDYKEVIVGYNLELSISKKTN